MTLIALALALLRLAQSLAGFAAARRSEAAGEAMIVNDHLTRTLRDIEIARTARRAVSDALRARPDGLRDDDGFRRD